jgi:2-dehydro-3-deoxygluconokinase
MSRIITIGEIMLRLTPPNNLRFDQTPSFQVFYGGDEANVAVSLSIFGLDTAYITKLPNNPFGQAAINYLRRYGVNTHFIARGGKRIGINFYEIGASMRPSKVIYDRSRSAIAEAEISDFNFNTIFKNAKWFHFSGITPALSNKATILTKKALETAKKNNVTISVDLNYRRKLWSPKKARTVMTELMQFVDVCIGNEEDAEITLGFKPKETDVYKGELNIDGYKEIFLEMKKKFRFKIIATTLRESFSASDNGWSALVFNGKKFYQSKKYNIHLVDRGGGGCAFAAGLIYGLFTGKNIEYTTEFATAASALKQTIFGDFNLSTLDEITQLQKGDTSGRIDR